MPLAATAGERQRAAVSQQHRGTPGLPCPHGCCLPVMVSWVPSSSFNSSSSAPWEAKSCSGPTVLTGRPWEKGVGGRWHLQPQPPSASFCLQPCPQLRAGHGCCLRVSPALTSLPASTQLWSETREAVFSAMGTAQSHLKGDGRMEGQTEGQVEGWRDRETEGGMDGGADGETDRGMEGQKEG